MALASAIFASKRFCSRWEKSVTSLISYLSMSGLNGFLITGFHIFLMEYTASLRIMSPTSSLNDTFFSFTLFIFTLAAIPSSSDSCQKKNESPTAGALGFPLGFGFGVGFGLGLSSPESAAADVPFLGAALGS